MNWQISVDSLNGRAKLPHRKVLGVLLSVVTVLVLLFSWQPLQVSRAAGQDGAVDPTFKSGNGPNQMINSLALQSDGKIIIGGSFSTFNGTRVPGLARLNSDSTVDTSFNVGSGANSLVFSIAVQADGKIIIGGIFTDYNGTTSNRIARLNSNGTLDSSFAVGSGANNTVNGLALQNDGKIVIGGVFTSYNGTAINRIARLNADGTLDSSFAVGSGANDVVTELAVQADGKIIIGGIFTGYNGTTSNRIARLNSNGTLDSSFAVGSGANNGVSSLALQSDGKIIIGGQFTGYNGTTSNRIARLNSNGSLDTTFNVGSGANFGVSSIAVQADGKVLIGGNFSTYNSIARNNLARLNSDGTLDNTFAVGTVFTIQIANLTLQSDGKILMTGQFLSYNNVGIKQIARLNNDGTLDTTFNVGAGANSFVNSLAVQNDDKIIISGQFDRYNGITRTRIARLNSDGSLDTNFNVGSGTNNLVYSIAIQSDGKILMGGEFNTYNGITTTRIARLNSDGSLDTNFNVGTGFNSTVVSIVSQSDGKILIGGDFNTYNGVGASRITRLNSDGSLDSSFTIGSGANNVIFDVAVQSDGKILIAGSFTTYNGTAINRIARLNSDGSLDNTFNVGSGVNNQIRSLAVQGDGKILIGGIFISYNGTTSNRIARLNSDGSLDSSFNTGIGSSSGVYSIVAQGDGKILIGGQFTSYNGTDINRIARLNSDGSLDISFNVGSGASDTVNSLALQSDGKIIIGGQFSSVDTFTRDYLARLENTIVCNPQLVTSVTDDGTATTCGTFSHALAQATSGTISFTLTSGNVITFTGSLTPTLATGVAVDGGVNGIVLNGNGVTGDGLRLGGNNTLTNLTIRNFGGRELLAAVSNAANQLFKVKVQN